MAAQTYTMRLRDGTISVVQGVVSETTEDVTIYDLTNYRDSLDAGYLGRELTGSFITPVVSPIPVESEDDVYNHVAPHNEIKKRTRIVFWSAAAGTGDVLGWVWADEVRAISIGTFTRV